VSQTSQQPDVPRLPHMLTARATKNDPKLDVLRDAFGFAGARLRDLQNLYFRMHAA